MASGEERKRVRGRDGVQDIRVSGMSGPGQGSVSSPGEDWVLDSGTLLAHYRHVKGGVRYSERSCSFCRGVLPTVSLSAVGVGPAVQESSVDKSGGAHEEKDAAFAPSVEQPWSYGYEEVEP